jgi:hypothetical protein
VVTRAEAEKALRLISRAWGRKQSGYVYFPWIDREEQVKAGTRRAGFHEGDSFLWPKQRGDIINHMLEHQDHDLYWTVVPFEYPGRSENWAMDEHALWADLDECDPNTLSEFPPTIAWESSPGRYQALWIAQSGDFQGASWPGNENQRMTYMIGADPSGWDTVQLLRIPGWTNHKPDYADENGNYPKGKLLWADGPTYMPGDFSDLPEVPVTEVTEALEMDIDGVDRLEVIARVRLKLNHRARELISAPEASGDKSESLWYLIRCLADVGCSIAEIVAVVRETVWNKFSGRQDEMRRLINEAGKAIAKRSEETIEKLEKEAEEEGIDRPDPQRFGFLLKNVKTPKYIIKDVLSEGACGFIAAEPKTYKSWIGLDMAMSVATGADFLGHFRVNEPGPVFYIQEEDPPATLRTRTAKIWVNKAVDKFELISTPEENGLYWLPPDKEEQFDPDINAYIQQGLVISNPAWQLWLDEQLTKGMNGQPYKLIIIDTLMMTAGDVDENRAQEMTTKVFKPLKTLSRKHGVAIQVIHHMSKGEKNRPGQRMLGSVANHAWGEDSIYLSRPAARDTIRMELESKVTPSETYRITNVDNKEWAPSVDKWRAEDDRKEEPESNGQQPRPKRRTRTAKDNPAITALREAGPAGMTTKQIAAACGVANSTAHRNLTRLLDQETVTRQQINTPTGHTNSWFLK